MTLDFALRATEILLAIAFLQQSAEHISGSHTARLLFIPRATLAVALLTGLHSQWVLLALCVHSIFVLHRFQGPYNGGSDRMGLLILYCLCLSRWLPAGLLSQATFGYLGIQVILSYFISGQVKIVNPEWRSGRALADVFSFSAYPVAEKLRRMANWPRLLWGASWVVMLFEVLFPLSFLNATVLSAALVLAAMFHLANAWLFGLNRFLWFWIASYPSLIWLQSRIIEGG
ncbi:HTTM domain-containing protein [uncultured Sulfitobacter sp.]|uniref:HTTM domain-containing protein n=1 Tax=uncultured Sulfitobacter sp. TaxID=191468 RepID=UPI0030DBBF07|tara:strand:- start:11139 stop:11828 length:690 start_codon:yes stop_codon:yes gene_type:complete